ARAGGAERNGLGFRADHARRRAAGGGDARGAFGPTQDAGAAAVRIGAVGYAVAGLVLITVRDAIAVVVAFDAAAAVGRRAVEHHAAADVAGDDQGGAALQQVVRVQLVEEDDTRVVFGGFLVVFRAVAGARSVAIAGGGDVGVDDDPPVDVAFDGEADRILTAYRDIA